MIARDWIFLHLAYGSNVARRRLITHHLPGLGEATATSWFFVDVPLGDGGDAQPGLEIGVELATDRDTETVIERWLSTAATEGLVHSAKRPVEAMVLKPLLFPGSTLPPCYPSALAVGSARTARILEVLSTAGIAVTSIPIIRTEVELSYAGLLLHHDDRVAAASWHATWLETIARPGDAALCDSPAGPWSTANIQLPPADAYHALRVPLRQHARSVVAADTASAELSEIDVLAAIVSRLAHIQVLRLRDPGDTLSLHDEAAITRSLATAPPPPSS